MGTDWDVTSEEGLIACYRATLPEVFRYAARLAGDRQRTEDLVQDVYLSLVRHARDGKVAEIGTGWLITSTKNRFLNLVTAEHGEQRRLRLAEPRPGEPSNNHVDDPGALDHALAPLSGRARAAVVLRYVLDLPVADVASHLGISRRATESLLARARGRVRDAEVRDA